MLKARGRTPFQAILFSGIFLVGASALAEAKAPPTFDEFDIKFTGVNESTKYYEFTGAPTSEGRVLVPGRVLILSRNGSAVVALSVKEVDVGSKKFNGQVVRTFQNRPSLVRAATYTAGFVTPIAPPVVPEEPPKPSNPEPEEKKGPQKKREEPKSPSPAHLKTFTLIPSFGVSTLSYDETFSSHYSEILLLTAIHGRYEFSRRWGLESELDLRMLSITSNPSTITARFINFSLGLGYAVVEPGNSWNLGVVFNTYYITSLVTENVLGYTGITGILIKLPMRFNADPSKGLGVVPRIGLLKSPTGSMGFDNRELGMGLHWNTPTQDRHFVRISLDYAELAMTISTVKIASKTYTLSVGYGW